MLLFVVLNKRTLSRNPGKQSEGNPYSSFILGVTKEDRIFIWIYETCSLVVKSENLKGLVKITDFSAEIFGTDLTLIDYNHFS